MEYTVAIYASPIAGHSAETALAFCETLLETGEHRIKRLFFLNEGVLNGAVLAEDQSPLPGRWQVLIQAHQLDAVLCVNSAHKRGMSTTDTAETGRLSVASGFQIAGIAQLVDAAARSDRLVTFGG